MKKPTGLKFFVALAGILSFLAGSSAFAQRGSDFALLDQHGVFHQLSRYRESKAVVLFVQANGDTVSRKGIPLLAELQDRYRDQGIIFLMLDAEYGATREEVLKELAELGVDIPVLLDTAQVVARTLDIKTTAEAFILDPKSYDILYRGPLDGQIAVVDADPNTPEPYLETALKAVLTARDDTPPEPPTVAGTPIAFVYEERIGDRQVSYQDEIVPILRRRCTTCHVEGGLAPWAMISHRMLQGWSPMIREVLITHRMPPGQIDTQVGEWDDIHEISDDEIALLVHWIDGGARRGGDADPLTQPEPEPPDWALGEPDLIVAVPPEKVPATGMVDFKLSRVDLNLTEDKWISAIAYDVGELSVLHSLLVYSLDAATPDDPVAGIVDHNNADFISLYVPGRTEEVFDDDSGFLLRHDRQLSFKLRYVTSGRELVDATRIGLYFRDTPPEYAVRNVITLNEEFVIPAGEDNHVERAQTPAFDQDVFVESFSPQIHTRGKSMTISALLPGGEIKPLINVDNYNFNWQMNYRLKERLPIPAGSRLVATTVYDNSAANPFNPDPEADVKVGVTTWDEIFSHYVRVLEKRAQ